MDTDTITALHVAALAVEYERQKTIEHYKNNV